MSQPPIQERTFHEWTKNNFYRTSYGSHFTQFPQEPKNTAIPGYQGYIPYIKSQNLYGERISAIARTAFSDNRLGKFEGLSSTGFNFDPKALIDKDQEAYSHKYGRQTILKEHPGIGVKKLETSYQGSFKRPQGLVKPTYFHLINSPKDIEKLIDFCKQLKRIQRHQGFKKIMYNLMDLVLFLMKA